MESINKVTSYFKRLPYKALLLKSLRVGLFAFVASFVISIVISIVFNIFLLENVSQLIQGSIGSDDQLTLNSIIKMTSFIMNISVFNRVAELKFGILVFSLIPFLSFYFADRYDNKREGFSMNHIISYAISAVIYAFLVVFEAFLSKGELIGTSIDFFTFGNFLSTFLIAFFIQGVIGFNYDAHGMSGIRATRVMMRIMLGITLVVAVVGSLYLMKGYDVPFSYAVVGLIILVPNIVIYGMFMMMGVSVSFSDSLVPWMEKYGVDVSFGGLPTIVQVGALLLFIGIIVFSLRWLNKDHYIKRLVSFALSFSLFAFFAAYCTTIKLGTIVFLKDVTIGVSLIVSVVMPFIAILSVGLLMKLIRDVIVVIKEK